MKYPCFGCLLSDVRKLPPQVEEEKEEDDGVPMSIIFGSQTGTVRNFTYPIQKNETLEHGQISTPDDCANSCTLFPKINQAEDFAQTLAAEAKNHGYSPVVKDLEEYNHEDDLAQEKFAVFLVETCPDFSPS